MNRNKLLTTGEKISWKSIPSKYISATSHALNLSPFTMFDFIKGDTSNTTSLSMMIMWVVGSHILHPLTSSPYQRYTYLIWVLLRKIIKKYKHHNRIISHLSNYQMTYSYLFLNIPIFCNRSWPSYQIAQPLMSTTIDATWHYWKCLFDPNFLAIISKFHGYEIAFIIYSQTLDWPANTSTFLQTHLSNLDTLLHLEQP